MLQSHKRGLTATNGGKEESLWVRVDKQVNKYSHVRHQEEYEKARAGPQQPLWTY